MKKITLFLSMALMLVLASCSSNTPEGVFKKAFKAFISEDYETFVSYLGDSDGNALTEAQQQQFVSLMGKLSTQASPKDEIADFKVQSADVSEDGRSAVVHYEVVDKDGETQESTQEMRKGSDGQWRMYVNK